MELLSQKYKIPHLDLSTFPVDVEAIKLVPQDQAQMAELAVFQIIGKQLKIGVHNPGKDETKATVKDLENKNYTCSLFLVSRHSLEHAWEYYKKIVQTIDSTAGSTSVHASMLQELQGSVRNLSEIAGLIEKTYAAGRISEALEVLLAAALDVGASDIHIEPQEESARLRLRIDGVLHDVARVPVKFFHLFLSRIKLLSELKLNIHDQAQDGRFTIKTPDGEIEVRTSTIPGPDGENIVLRVLDPKNIGVKFEALGLQPWVIELLGKELQKPNGMILTTGPTGSGKTTTLYAFLKKVQNPEIKIITLENPIEYHLPGIEQTQVSPEKGYTFAAGLRASLRQDPDVILVGEIRDQETAETAMQAALTGHLVFSTLHTNNAAGTIPRLLDLGAKPSVIAPALNVAIAQRLLRKLCPACRKATEITPETKEKIAKELAGFPQGIPTPKPEEWKIFESSGDGCEKCTGGYKGRIGIYEIIMIDEKIEQLILKSPSEFEIQKEALNQGQINMRQDGLLKILAGITDFSEVEKAVG